MAEVTTRQCLDCPVQIVIPPGRGQKPLRCADCKSKNQKARDAARHRAKQEELNQQWESDRPHFQCVDCSESFPKPHRDGPMPKRCDACGHRHRLARLGISRRAATLRRRPKSYRCQICLRTRPVRNARGPVPRICPGCQLENRARVARASYVEKVSPIRPSFICDGCRQEFPLARKGYSRRRCDPCAELLRKAHSRAWIKARPELQRANSRECKRRRRLQRRAVAFERFTDREVFDRDNWTCGLCGDPVDRTLRFPNLMAASLDHQVPLNRGGAHTRANTRCTHFLCNSRKSDRLDSEVLHLFPTLALIV
jgi:hypothetical protein